MIATAAQAGHFSEELMTGFHERVPAFFGPAADIAAPLRLVQPGMAGGLGAERVGAGAPVPDCAVPAVVPWDRRSRQRAAPSSPGAQRGGMLPWPRHLTAHGRRRFGAARPALARHRVRPSISTNRPPAYAS